MKEVTRKPKKKKKTFASDIEKKILWKNYIEIHFEENRKENKLDNNKKNQDKIYLKRKFSLFRKT